MKHFRTVTTLALFVCCLMALWPMAAFGADAQQLAGRSLNAYPHFEFVRTFNSNESVKLGVDPSALAGLTGVTCPVYVVATKTASEWASDPTLTDVRSGGAQTVSFVAGSIVNNVVTLATANELNADAGIGLGVGYDVVIDVDGDGQLSGADVVDGVGDQAGFYVVHDTTATGPLARTIVEYEATGIESGLVKQRIFYPTAINTMGALPLVVISHGNGHQYHWYDYLQQHLASYGYIVMSHENNTRPGINSCSLDTLQHTDAFLGQLSSIAGGALVGHVDSSRIVWIGHSRGAEGVVRAFDRLVDDDLSDTTWRPSHYDETDIVLISSIAPTDFLGPQGSNPHSANFHLLYGAADGDVTGNPFITQVNSFPIFERAEGTRQSTYVHGADHNDFNLDGPDDFIGPPATEIGRTEAQKVAKGIYLPLIKHYTEGNLPARDFLWRQYETFRPQGVSSSTIVVNDYKGDPGYGALVIDDYQDPFAATGTSSSLGVVSSTVTDIKEGLLLDENKMFDLQDPMNGMSRARPEDSTRGVRFEWDADAYMAFDVVETGRDFSPYEWLSLRACQLSRHANTVAALEDLTFTITLLDGNGGSSAIDIGSYGGGIEEPYQRAGGWANEFETIWIRLDNFRRDGSNLDLSDVVSIRLDFGPSFGSPVGAIGLDDLQLLKADNMKATTGLVITQTDGSTIVAEGGASDTYAVTLLAAPTADVTVSIGTDGQTSITPTSLVFTSVDWDVPQTVTVTAVDDSAHERQHDGVAFHHTDTIVHTTTSSDQNWDSLSQGLTIGIWDNDNIAPDAYAGEDQTVLIVPGPPWTPAEMTSLAWYDASDLSTVTTSGGKVSEWRDKSGNARHATQPQSDKRPAWQPSDPMLGGLPSIGSSSNLSWAGLDTPQMTAKRIYAVTYYGDGTDETWNNGTTLFGGPNGGLGVKGVNPNKFFLYPTVTFNDYGTFKNGSTVSSMVALPMPASLFVFITSTASTQVFSLGYLDDLPNSAGLWRGAYSEFIFTDGNEDLATQQAVEGYLAHKWGFPDKLPADHPYKVTPPNGDAAVVTLDGMTTDDDGDDVSVTWSKIDGPDLVSFDNKHLVNTTATFGKVGTYVLRMTADDGYGPVHDDIIITVTETMVDSDNDGLDDDWELAHFETLGDTDGTGDADGDGVKDFWEYITGTDPNVADANLLALEAGPSAHSPASVFKWTVKDGFVAGVHYQVLYSTNLSGWTPLPQEHYTLTPTVVNGMNEVEMDVTYDYGPHIFITLDQP